MRIPTSIVPILMLVAWVAPGLAQDVITLTDPIDGGTGGLAVDALGNVYIADFGPDLQGHGTRVFQVTPAGSVSVFASGFDGASGNDFDSQGNLFQSNISAWRVDKIAPDGTVTPFSSAFIYAPVGIAIDEDDNLYVCNCGTHNIRRITPEGVSTNFSGGGLFQCPNGITLDDAGNVYVANFQNGNVIKIVPGNPPSLFATIPGNNNGHITYHDGLLYVAARGANQIYTITLSGEVNHFAGTGVQGIVDGPRLEAQFSRPNDLIVDPTGTYLYVNDVVDPTSTNDISPMVLRRIDLSAAVGVESMIGAGAGGSLRVHSVRPNPFQASTTFAFGLDRSIPVRLTIHDVSGREVQKLIDRELTAGEHEAVWSGVDVAGRAVASGVYFYRFSTIEGSETGPIHVVR